MKAALPWVAFGALVVLATAPVWRLGIVGLDPSLDQLLQMSASAGSFDPVRQARPTSAAARLNNRPDLEGAAAEVPTAPIILHVANDQRAGADVPAADSEPAISRAILLCS
jgi:hypothetical protein